MHLMKHTFHAEGVDKGLKVGLSQEMQGPKVWGIAVGEEGEHEGTGWPVAAQRPRTKFCPWR